MLKLRNTRKYAEGDRMQGGKRYSNDSEQAVSCLPDTLSPCRRFPYPLDPDLRVFYHPIYSAPLRAFRS